MTAARDAKWWVARTDADAVLPKPFEIRQLLDVPGCYTRCVPRHERVLLSPLPPTRGAHLA
jgi:hypothetical protein